MNSNALGGLLLLSLALTPAPMARAGQACPADAEEINRTVRADQTVIRCRCLGERLYYGGSCQAPEAAPLTTKALGVITGTVFSAGAALQVYARKRNWPAPAILFWDFATLEAKFGRYQRARALLELTRDLIKTDEVLVTVDSTLASFQQFREKQLARYLQNYPASAFALIEQEFNYQNTKDGTASWIYQTDCDARCYAKDKRALFFRALTDADLDRRNGDYTAAIAKFRDALHIANLAELSPSRRRAASAGIIWSRQLRASWQERQTPGTWQDFNRTRRNEVAAARAEILASHLSQAGQGRVALAYLEEARAYYQANNPGRAPYIARQIARLRADAAAFAMPRGKDDRPLTIYTNATSQTNIMFDAIEYGKGDWSRSIKYLEAALAADPKNKKIFGALNYVKGMSAAGRAE